MVKLKPNVVLRKGVKVKPRPLPKIYPVKKTIYV